MYQLGVVIMVLTFFFVLAAVYVLFISGIKLGLVWSLFWHFVLILSGLVFKLAYMLVLTDAGKEAA